MKMVNLLEAQKPLLHILMKMAGIKPYTLEIEPGTTMHFWVPSETIKMPKKTKKSAHATSSDVHNIIRPTKPVVVFIHGFAGDGIFTWQFHVSSLTRKYSVYIPDLLFFGGSITDKMDRSPKFQAECLVKGLSKLGVEKCTLVGFSYGGMVAFNMAEMYPELVQGLVISGSILTMTDSLNHSILESLGVLSLSELLLPTSVKGLKSLFKMALYKKIWFPHRLYKDYLEVMFTNRKERGELLEGLIVRNKNTFKIPHFLQQIYLLWGENDQMFSVELAHNMKEALGNKTTFTSIMKAGHLVHLERPSVYNRCLKQFLATQMT